MFRRTATRLYAFEKMWPVYKTNTIMNVCEQDQLHVVERLGSYNCTQTPGMYFTIPFLDSIRVVPTPERSLEISPQEAVTKDNVKLAIAGVVYVVMTDPVNACYGHSNPYGAMRSHAMSAMRAAVGKLTLDETWHDRARLNMLVLESIQEAASNWGHTVRRYEITSITPDETISKAMDAQAAAERRRRAEVTTAEASKSSAILKSEGERLRIQNEASGRSFETMVQAEAAAYAVHVAAEAQAGALKAIADVASNPGGLEAMQIYIAKEYIGAMGKLAGTSNTLVFGGDGPADLSKLALQLKTVFTAFKAPGEEELK